MSIPAALLLCAPGPPPHCRRCGRAGRLSSWPRRPPRCRRRRRPSRVSPPSARCTRTRPTTSHALGAGARFTDDILPALASRALASHRRDVDDDGACGKVEDEGHRGHRANDRAAQGDGGRDRAPAAPREGGRRRAARPRRDVRGVRVADQVEAGRLRPAPQAHREAPRDGDPPRPPPPRTPERPLVLVYGARAAQRSSIPARGLEAYAFGPAIFALEHGDYREVDLYVPELVERLEAMRAEAWLAAWKAFGHERGDGDGWSFRGERAFDDRRVPAAPEKLAPPKGSRSPRS